MARRRATGRRRSDDGYNDSGRWQTTYGDAMTLLLAFFVMLYVMSEIDVQKFEAFVRGLEVPFGNPAVHDGLLPAGDGIVGDIDLPDPHPPEAVRLADELPGDPELLGGAGGRGEQGEAERVERPGQDAPVDGLAHEADRDLDQLRAVREELAASLGDAGFADAADYRIDERGLVVSISADDILFALGSTEISDDGRELLAAVGEVLAGHPNDLIIEGHTDDVPLDRDGYSNWNLSTDRAVAVLSLLFEDLGFSQERLGAAGYGEFRPVKPNDSPENRAKNRRVDVLVVAQGVQ